MTMTYVKRAALILLGGLVGGFCVLGSTSERPQWQLTAPQAQAQTTSTKSAVPPIVYHPPQRGAPGWRVGGGTRGPANEVMLAALTPDHIGLTAQARPSLYWYVSGVTPAPIELIVTREQAIHPLVETRLQPPARPGIHRVRLADYGIQLEPGVLYKWFVSLVFDPASRAKDLVAGGAITRTELSAAVQAQLKQVDKHHIPRLYAELGLWYDALAAISDLLEAAPQDTELRARRAALLEQVGLTEVAAYDKRPTP